MFGRQRLSQNGSLHLLTGTPMPLVGGSWASNTTTSVRGYTCLYSDLVPPCSQRITVQEESPQVQRVCTLKFKFNLYTTFHYILFYQALNRLTPGELYDRSYRLKRASQASVLHAPLPKEHWTKAEDVCHVDSLISLLLFTTLSIGR